MSNFGLSRRVSRGDCPGIFPALITLPLRESLSGLLIGWCAFWDASQLRACLLRRVSCAFSHSLIFGVLARSLWSHGESPLRERPLPGDVSVLTLIIRAPWALGARSGTSHCYRQVIADREESSSLLSVRTVCGHWRCLLVRGVHTCPVVFFRPRDLPSTVQDPSKRLKNKGFRPGCTFFLKCFLPRDPSHSLHRILPSCWLLSAALAFPSSSSSAPPCRFPGHRRLEPPNGAADELNNPHPSLDI